MSIVTRASAAQFVNANLHQYEDVQATQFLRTVFPEFDTQTIHKVVQKTAWDQLERSGLPGILMDIVLEAVMFSEQPDTFKLDVFSVFHTAWMS